jgi:hypothetical protein
MLSVKQTEEPINVLLVMGKFQRRLLVPLPRQCEKARSVEETDLCSLAACVGRAVRNVEIPPLARQLGATQDMEAVAGYGACAISILKSTDDFRGPGLRITVGVETDIQVYTTHWIIRREEVADTAEGFLLLIKNLPDN